MAYESALNLRNAVSVVRTTQTADGMGGYTSTTATTLLGKAAIWSVSGNERWVSEQMMAISSHILACRSVDDVQHEDAVTYGSVTYQVVGHADDVLNMGLVKIVPMKRIN